MESKLEPSNRSGLLVAAGLLIGAHHVKPGPNQLAWDMGFLTLGAILALVGWILLRSGQKENV
ncbi:MAG TPA: DUF2243 domain-containing protein [Coleofasciculaceae cyanobacterium]